MEFQVSIKTRTRQLDDIKLELIIRQDRFDLYVNQDLYRTIWFDSRRRAVNKEKIKVWLSQSRVDIGIVKAKITFTDEIEYEDFVDLLRRHNCIDFRKK